MPQVLKTATIVDGFDPYDFTLFCAAKLFELKQLTKVS
jgi:hypothetical protein